MSILLNFKKITLSYLNYLLLFATLLCPILSYSTEVIQMPNCKQVMLGNEKLEKETNLSINRLVQEGSNGEFYLGRINELKDVFLKAGAQPNEVKSLMDLLESITLPSSNYPPLMKQLGEALTKQDVSQSEILLCAATGSCKLVHDFAALVSPLSSMSDKGYASSTELFFPEGFHPKEQKNVKTEDYSELRPYQRSKNWYLMIIKPSTKNFRYVPFEAYMRDWRLTYLHEILHFHDYIFFTEWVNANKKLIKLKTT